MKRTFQAPEDDFQVTSFTITLQQTKVYRNGRQQARIKLRVEAKRGGVASHLTKAEEKGIRVFDYEAEKAVLPYTHEYGAVDHRGWAAQHESRGYDYHPASGSDDSPSIRKWIRSLPRRIRSILRSSDLPPQDFYFYVTANEKALQNLVVAFAITGDDGSIYRSNGWSDKGGKRDYSSALDEDTGVTLAPDSPIVYSSDNFVLSRRPTTPAAASGRHLADDIFDDIVAISIRDAGGQDLTLRHMTCTPAGVIHWINKLEGTMNPCFTGYASPGDEDFTWNDEVQTGGIPKPTLATVDKGKCILVLCGRIDIRPYSGAPDGSLALQLIDGYGTIQTCGLRFVEHSRDDLEVI